MTTETLPASLTINAPEAATLTKGAAAALAMVQSFEISDATTYGLAADELKEIKARATKLEDHRKSLTAPLDAVKKGIMDLFRAPLEVLGQAEGILKGKLLDYTREEQRKAGELQLAAERAAQAERNRLEAEAKKLADDGKAGEAAVKSQVAAMIVAQPVAAPAVPQTNGIALTKTIDFEVVDTLALVQHVAKTPELLALLMVDSTKLRAYVRGLGTAASLPGVRVFEKQGLSASRR